MGYKTGQNFFTRQDLHGSAICLRPQSYRDFTIIKEKYKVRQYSFSLTQKLHLENPNHQNNSFYFLRIGFTMGYKKAKNFSQDNIYTVQQFVYVHGIVGISLLSGKNTKCGSTIFLSLKNYIQKTLITKTTVSISYAQDSQWATKRAKNFSQDNIYVVWQFAYVHRVVGISLLSGKNSK